MFIRKKPNKSGTFTVQVVQKDRATRKNRVIKTIGTSSDSTELASMVREAQDYIDDQNGPMLPMDYDDPFETGLEEFLEGILNAQLQVIGPELILGRFMTRLAMTVSQMKCSGILLYVVCSIQAAN